MSEDGSGASRPELLRALGVLCEPPDPAHRRLTGLLEIPGPIRSDQYADVFLFQLYPYASVHLGPEGMLGGEARERVAGFWRAVGRTPPAEPDHLSALLGLYAALRRSAPAAGGAEAVMRARSADALLHEHLASWLFPFLDRVDGIAPDPLRRWASLLSETLRQEVERAAAVAGSPLALPVHLSAAPALPDPRVSGAGAFLAGLLAPVRSGVTLVRSDVARLARSLGLGLRAGERRYALEHLLAQDAPPVLAALADEAARRAEQHEAREAWLGATARFQADRARSTSALLAELASTDGALRSLDPEEAVAATGG